MEYERRSSPCEPDRRTDLLDVRVAGVAFGEVRLEALAHVGRERVFEVIRDELDELAAREVRVHP